MTKQVRKPEMDMISWYSGEGVEPEIETVDVELTVVRNRVGPRTVGPVRILGVTLLDESISRGI